MIVVSRSGKRASYASLSSGARLLAHHAPVIGRLTPRSPSAAKARTPPPTIWKTLANPSRRTRFALVAVTIPLALIVASPAVKELAESDEPFNPQSFTSFTLSARESISSTSSIFTLKLKRPLKSSDPYSELWKKGLWSLEFKQPQLQIARSYTPLPPLVEIDGERDDSALELKFLIRHDGWGEVSNYLSALPIGSNIELRGPRMEYRLPEEVDEIVFLAGGTGIGPALQTIQTLLSRSAESGLQIPKVKILWANRKREDCVGGVNAKVPTASLSLPRRLLSSFRTSAKTVEIPEPPVAVVESQNPIVRAMTKLRAEHPDHISLEFFVDEEKTQIDTAAIKHHLRDRKPVHDDDASGAASKLGKKLIMISGPDGFVDYLAGPKGWRLSVQVQGDLGGILSQMNTEEWEVRKL